MTSPKPVADDALRRLGKLIREAREDRRWTQDQLAEAAGVSRPTVQRYENAKTAPEFDKVRAIILALGVDAREIPVALGLVTREEMNLPPERTRPRQFDPTTEEILGMLEDPRVSLKERQALARLLRVQLDERPGSQAG